MPGRDMPPLLSMVPSAGPVSVQPTSENVVPCPTLVESEKASGADMDDIEFHRMLTHLAAVKAEREEACTVWTLACRRTKFLCVVGGEKFEDASTESGELAAHRRLHEIVDELEVRLAALVEAPAPTLECAISKMRMVVDYGCPHDWAESAMKELESFV